ncbi:MAG: hypothetical protein JXA20_11735 [Spirochaetes bacterium]|nr:hypothetical protein [Spirochaetota bacterium]
MMKTMALKALAPAALLILAALCPVSAEELFEGDVFLAGTNRGTLLFRQKNGREVKGDDVILRHTYTDLEGKLAALEEVTLRKGRIHDYHVEMPLSKCGCRMQKKGDRIVFSFTRGGGEAKESDYTGGIVTGPTLRDFIADNWQPLAAGKTVYFKLPAMSLQRVAEFQLQRDPSSPYAREGVMVVRMKIASYLLRLFVDPVDLVLETGTKRMAEIHGKSLLIRRVGGRLENPVVDIYYRYR